MRPDCGPPSRPVTALPPMAEARGPWRWVLVAIAWTSLALGVIGMFLPVLPTVPFILLASWAGMRSSRRVHRYLETHRLFGPILCQWRTYRAVHRRAKCAATLSMAAGAAILWWTSPSVWVNAVACAVMATVAVWLWLRPEPPLPRADS